MPGATVRSTSQASDQRGTLLATSRTVVGLHSHHLRAQPSRLLKYPSHFGHFISWLGCDLSSPTLAVYEAPADGSQRRSPPLTASVASTTLAGHGDPVKDEPAAGVRGSKKRSRRGGEKSTSRPPPPDEPAQQQPTRKRICAACDSATAKPGVCHKCWFNQWDATVQLKNMEQKAAARLDSLRAPPAPAARPSLPTQAEPASAARGGAASGRRAATTKKGMGGTGGAAAGGGGVAAATSSVKRHRTRKT